MSNLKQDLIMETTHARKRSCKTEFKAVLNKVLVSTLVLASVLGSTGPAFAAEVSIKDQVNQSTVTQEYGVSIESAISNIRNTISAINAMRSSGKVSDGVIKQLASQLYALETSVSSSGGSVSSDVKSVINEAEKAISGLSNTEAQVALDIVKESLGLKSTVTVENKSANITTSFSDVTRTSNESWAYDAIMDMTSKGLFAGVKQADKNGVGFFGTTQTMTRAQFVLVIVRANYKAELDALPAISGENGWWQNAYAVALDKGLLTDNDFDKGRLTKDITRQEMALVLVRAAEKNGDVPSQLIDTSRIPDFNTVGTYYQPFVRKAYSMGLIAGTHTDGTYSPAGVLNRAQGATVLYRLVEPSTRGKVDFSKPADNVAGAMTIIEGQLRTTRLAQVGDTVVKADGTKVVLKLGPNGILGEGQGVAPDLGLTSPNGVHVVKDDKSLTFGYDYGKDSAGFNVKQSDYCTNSLTGEGHWGAEWSKICKASMPTAPGTKDMQLSSDKNWVWSESTQDWYTVAGNNYF